MCRIWHELTMAPGLVEHFPQVDAGTKTRAIAATVVDLDDTRSLIAERDENETAKPFTVSERVAIGRAIEERLAGRQGQRTDLRQEAAEGSLPAETQLPADWPEVLTGTETRDIAAKRAGFDSTTAYRRAKQVVESGSPELVEAVDEGEVSVSAAAEIARQPHDEQREIVARGRDENETAKPVTVSERVAIGRAIEERLGERRGRPSENVQNSAQFDAGTKTRALAAERAGFGNHQTYRQAKAVVESGSPELVEPAERGGQAGHGFRAGCDRSGD